MTAAFDRNAPKGFADWRHCGYMRDEVCEVLWDAFRDLSSEEVFDLTCDAYLKWGRTDKDDSNGETQDLVGDIFGIWERLPAEEGIFSWIMGHCDGSMIDYMEDFLLDYLMDHFRSEEQLRAKLAFFEQRIKKNENENAASYTGAYEVRLCRERVLRLMGELKYPIEEIRAYGGPKEVLAQIEMDYGCVSNAIGLYEELAAAESSYHNTHHKKLKELYKRYGPREKYEQVLRDLLFRSAGDNELLKEYKEQFTEAEWPEVSQRLFACFSVQDPRILGWLRDEGHFERMMQTIEQQEDGEFWLDLYGETLKDLFPKRCLSVLVLSAERKAGNVSSRNGYRSLAGTLARITKYEGGGKIAAELAEKYIARFPRRPAMREELCGFLRAAAEQRG